MIHLKPQETLEGPFDPEALKHIRNWAAHHFDGHIFSTAKQYLTQRTDLMKVPFNNVLDLSPPHTPGIFEPGELYNTQMHVNRSETIDFPNDTFDLIYSPLALHWINDPRSYLLKIHHVLRPGGLFLANFWGGHTLMELRHCLAEIDFEVYAHVHPRIIPMMRLQDANTLFQSTPFQLKVVDQDTFTFYYADLKTLARHLKRMGEGNALKERVQTPPPHDFWPRVESLYRKNYGKSHPQAHEVGLPATFHLITLTGWKDGPDIPKALSPGSATYDLDAALKGTNDFDNVSKNLKNHRV